MNQTTPTKTPEQKPPAFFQRAHLAVNAAQAAEAIGNAKKLLFLSHVDPDVDTLGTALALYLGAKKLGRDCTVYNVDGTPETMGFLRGSEDVVTKLPPRKHYDLVVACDAGNANRFGSILLEEKDQPRFKQILCVDHHPHGDAFADMAYLDSTRSSSGELAYDILTQEPFEMDQDIAFNLYAALVSDTGSFRYGNTNSNSFKVAGELLEHGISAWDVSVALYENRPLIQVKIVAEVLRTLEVSACGRYASVYASLEMLRALGLDADDKKAEVYLDGLINFPRGIQGVEAAIFLKERKDGWKVSMRSKGLVDVSSICRRFGGGGHKNAAGCFFEGSFHRAKQLLTESIEAELTRQLAEKG